MGRSLVDIQNSIVSTIKNQNVTYDTSKGPIYDTVVAPLREEIYEEELSIDDLKRLLTYRFGDAVTVDEADAFAAAFGISRPTGNTSKGAGVLYVYSKPATDLLAERGTGVTTETDLYDFIVTEEKYMYLDNISSYYNADSNRYELPVAIESVGKGFAAELPEGTINKISYGGTFWDGFINTTETSGSTEDADNLQLIGLVKEKFAAHNDSGAWLEYDIIEQFPTVISDVQSVYSKDRELFVRLVTRPSIDFYIYGSQIKTEDFSFTAEGGETTIYLDKLPISYITNVFVNNVSVSFTYIEPEDQYYKSARSTGYINLDSTLGVGDFVKVNYSYNHVLYTLQQIYDDPNQELMFGTDILFREFNTAGIIIVLQLRINKNYNDIYIKNEIESLVADFLEDSARTDFILPTTLKNIILETVPGVMGVKIPIFRREYGYTSASEAIELTRIEVASLSSLLINTSS